MRCSYPPLCLSCVSLSHLSCAFLSLSLSLSLICLSLFCRLGGQVIDAYTRMLKAKKGEIDAIVTTAEPLTPQQEKALASGLKAQVTAWFLAHVFYRCRCRCRWAMVVMDAAAIIVVVPAVAADSLLFISISHPIYRFCGWRVPWEARLLRGWLLSSC